MSDAPVLVTHAAIYYADFTGLVWLLYLAAFNAGITIPVTGTALLTLVNATATLVASGLAAGAAALLAPRPEMPTPSDGQLTIKQAIPVRRRGYGRCKVGGVFAFVDQYGPLLYAIILLHSGKISAFVEEWFDDKQVTFDGSGNVETAPWFLFGVPWVSRARRFGEDAEDPYDDFDIQVYFPDAWSEDHELNGAASVLLRSSSGIDVEFFQNVFETGTAPAYRAVLDLSLVYDPRLDSTVTNGSGSHRWDDPDTWEWSENPVLCVLDYLTHLDGMGLDRDRWWTDDTLQEWMAAADICEEQIDLNEGGTHDRYATGGIYHLDVESKNPLRALLAACDGYVYMRSDNTIGIKVGKYEAPTVTIGTASIRSFQLSSGAGALSEFNSLVGIYNSPDHDWQEQEADPWVDQDLIDAYGEKRERLELYWVTDHRRARRLMKRHFLRANAPWRGKIVTDLQGLRVLGNRWAAFTIPALGLTAEPFEILKPSLDIATMSVVFDVVMVGSEIDAWDETTEEGTPPAIPPGIDAISDPDAAIIIAAMDSVGAAPNEIEELAINSLVVALKSADIWDTADWIHVGAAKSATAANLDWTNVARSVTANNSPNFKQWKGYKGNGVDAWLDSGVSLAGLTNSGQNDMAMAIWSLTDAADDSYAEIGAVDADDSRVMALRANGSMRTNANASTNEDTPVDDSLGLHGWSRAASGTYKVFKDGEVLETVSITSTGIESGNLCFLRSGSQYTNRRVAFAIVCTSLTNAQITQLNAAVRTYLQRVGAI